MAERTIAAPMRIEVSSENRERLVAEVRRFSLDEFDRDLSEFQANRWIDFFVRHLGAPVYNQAIRDARSFLQAKLDDLDGEFYEPEETD